ncbi:hypothetical protein HMPREF1022_01576 [Desulfovibrio sp. 6_1_46AFAA]|uniref:methyl-accepting chemotaxis protein n=1 Tax=unclassified Desulfovibrio TaxID=2593640 RepID=UPI0001E12A41|nr:MULTISPECIES: methyl-accepting chemotaxis protein [unclassified Desulfovibrio]EFL87195.1 hypothetical protein HMPREF0326_00970 [Desulfovibrio sp. 3_1_syn3]EGW51367.1 hypothetical protein HMPREF1022_01576 [Desulfovibrio sp. 6_1_46AFAA]
MKLRLLPKMLLFILLPALLGLCAVTWFSYVSAEKSLEAQIGEDLDMMALSETSQLESVTGLLRNVLNNGANIARINNFLRASSDEERASLRPGMQQALKSLAEDFPLLKDVGLIGPDGIVVGHTNTQKGKGMDLGERPYFTASMQGKSSVQNTRSKTTGQVTTILSAPVMNGTKALGVIYATLDLKSLSAETTDSIKIGKTGACFVYDGSGLLLMHPNKDYIGDEDGKLDWVRQILAQGSGRLVYGWGGKEKVAYFRSIPAMNWFVLVSVERAEVLAPAKALLRSNSLISGGIALLVGLIIFLVARSIAGALREGAHFVGRVAEGHFEIDETQRRSLEKSAARTDEIGALARGVGAMVENLKQLFADSEQKTREAHAATEEARQAMREAEEARKAAEGARREGMLSAAGQLEEVAAVLSSASTQLSAQIEQSDRGAAESATRLSEAATAMNEMNATVQEVARNAGSASSASAETKEKAEAGAQVVEKAVRSIEDVHQMSLALKGDMAQLNEHARDISRIMAVISDIADQTNLLALNAAIEAARAGEAGRGFAVVADEVRKLAEKTMASTNDVGNAITAIQESTAKSMTGVDNAVERIGEANELASRSGAALEEIVATVVATGDQVNAIATASEEQSAASEEINQSIVQVNDMSRQTAGAMAEASKAVSDLAAQAQRLNELIIRMKEA